MKIQEIGKPVLGPVWGLKQTGLPIRQPIDIIQIKLVEAAGVEPAKSSMILMRCDDNP
jgi:hypothetical protein